MAGALAASDRLPWRTIFSYALPGLPLALLISPFPALLFAFYAKHTEATTAGIATIVLLARIFNGVVDLPIGYLSDRTHTRWGPRKPWLIGGALLSIVAFLIAYMPPANAGNAYFALAIFSFYLAFSVIDTPYKTWSGEITPDYAQRSRLAGAVTVSLLIGGVGFLAVPEVLSQLGVLKSAELNREGMAVLGQIGIVLMPICILLACAMAPVGTLVVGKPYRLRDMLTVFTENAPFRRFLFADFVSQVGWATSYALMAITLDNYFGFGDKVVLFLLAATAAQIVAVPACTFLSARFGKHNVYAWCQIVNGIAIPGYLLFPPGGAADFSLMLAFGAVVSMLGTPNMMFPQAILSDVADYDTWKTGQARAGTYFASRTMLAPAGAAVGGAIGFYMLAIVGFDPSSATNSAAATNGMLATAVGIPAMALLVSGAAMLGYPITAKRHRALRSRIERRGLSAS